MRLQLLSSLALVACSSDPSAPATFERASDEQLQRTAFAAMSMDTVFLGFVAAGYASAPDTATGCPKISTSSDGRRHVTGGCTTAEGERVDGELILQNVPGIFDEADPSLPQVIEAVDFSLTNASGPIRANGTLTTLDGVGEASIDVEIFGINVHTESRMSCPDGLCSYESASIDVDGLGSATVSGTFSFDGSNLVELQVIGADTLSIGSDGQCLTMRAGAKSYEVCDELAADSATAPKARNALEQALELRTIDALAKAHAALQANVELRPGNGLELKVIDSTAKARAALHLQARPGLELKVTDSAAKARAALQQAVTFVSGNGLELKVTDAPTVRLQPANAPQVRVNDSLAKARAALQPGAILVGGNGLELRRQ